VGRKALYVYALRSTPYALMLSILADVITPVFVLIGAGYMVGRTLGVDRRALGRVVLYIFAPALALDQLTKSQVSSEELGRIVAFVLLATGSLGVLVWLGARLAHTPTPRTNALLLSTLLMNTGNYGLSASLFAFGEPGLERAVMYFSVSQILMYTLGVYLASRGTGTGGWQPLLNIVRLPVFWAFVLALAVRAFDWPLPGFIAKAAALGGPAAVPVLLVALGIELSHVKAVREWPGVGVASFIRLVVSVPVGLAVGLFLGLSGVTLAVCLLQFAMPTAVTPVALAMEFGSDPEFVTGVIFVTTLASVVSLTILLAFIR
jgi:malate permease and related proteins